MAQKRIYRYNDEFVKQVNLKYYDMETKRRYRLDVELKKGKSTDSVLIIMMNPSKANDKISDNTINRVIKYVFLNNEQGVLKDIGRIIFTNLYVVYETDSDKVNGFSKKYSWEFIQGVESDGKYNNDRVIRESKREAKVIIIAWGKGDIEGYDARIKKVLKLVDKRDLFHVSELTVDGYPRHPRNWSYSWPLIKYLPQRS